MVYAYYGLGQGKTSTLNGLCLRAINKKKPILFVRFFKGVSSSEDFSLKQLGVEVNSFQTTNHFIWTKNINEQEKIIEQAKQTVDYVNSNYERFDFIFLDEAIDLVTNKIMTSNLFVDFIRKISHNKVVFISGHYMDETISSVCDVLTHFEKKKHHYDKGVSAIKYIDF